MPYVIRDAEGRIVQVFDRPVTGKAEVIATDSVEYQQYLDDHAAHSAEELRRQLAAANWRRSSSALCAAWSSRYCWYSTESVAITSALPVTGRSKT